MSTLPRRLLGAAGASSAAAAVAAYYDESVRRRLVIPAVGATARAFVRGANSLTLHDAHHLDAGLQRASGTGLLTVSNHISTMDDPGMLASIVPLRTLCDPDAMRWGVCAQDVCFKPGSWVQRCASTAKVLPVVRGGGVFQRELDEIAAKLLGGEWVHYFPEGKIWQDGHVHRFRRGVGRLVAAVPDPKRLLVVPYYHTGADTVQPTSAESTSFFSRPNLNTPVHVIFGAPLDLSALLALRAEPPFDRRPELLYEVIAHTLEEEVRRLQAELRRRLAAAEAEPG